MGDAPKGWVDQVLSKVTDAHLQGDALTEPEKVWLTELTDRRTQGDSRIDARDLNMVAAIAAKLGIKREAAPQT